MPEQLEPFPYPIPVRAMGGKGLRGQDEIVAPSASCLRDRVMEETDLPSSDTA